MQKKSSVLTRPLTVVLLAILCNALWGSAIPFINLGYRLFEIPAGETATQILFAGCRFFLSGVLTILLTSIPRRALVRVKRENLHMVVKLALMQTVIQYVLFYIGVARTTGVKGAIIQGLNAFVAILVACYLFHTESMNLLKWLGGAVGVAGVIVMNLGGSVGGGLSLTGEGFLLVSMLVSACSAGTIKIFGQKEDPVALSGWQFALGGAVMAAIGFALGGRLHAKSLKAVLVLLYLAGVSGVAYTVWSVLLKHNPVSRIAPFMFLQPLFGVALSLAFDPQTPVAYAQCGAALLLVCASIVILGRAQGAKPTGRRREKPEASAPKAQPDSSKSSDDRKPPVSKAKDEAQQRAEAKPEADGKTRAEILKAREEMVWACMEFIREKLPEALKENRRSSKKIGIWGEFEGTENLVGFQIQNAVNEPESYWLCTASLRSGTDMVVMNYMEKGTPEALDAYLGDRANVPVLLANLKKLSDSVDDKW